MLDINKLRNAYNVIHRMSQNRHPFAEEGCRWRLCRARRYRRRLPMPQRLLLFTARL